MLARTATFSPARIYAVLLFLATFLAALHMTAFHAEAAQATLNWKAPTTYVDGTSAGTLGGYKIYEGTASGNYTQVFDVGNVTSYTLSGLNDATTYYYAISAYDATGTTSDLSNELSFTTPAATAALYTLSASAGAGGSISPSGSVVVSQGVNQTFTITPSSGYVIAGVTVDGASVGSVPAYTFTGVAANHTINATFAPAAQSTAGVSAFAVDAGGNGYTSSSGIVYKADTGFTGGRIGTTTAAIAGTSDVPLYQTERYGNFSYSVPLANGTYNVTLKFAEIYWTAAGKRIFNVTMNGSTVISGLDLYAMVGKNKAYDVVVPATVTNGVLTIGFVTKVDNATVTAIRIAPTSAPATPAGTVVFADNAGGSQYAGSGGITYAADSKYTGGKIGTTTAAISGTTDVPLYQNERYGNVTYSVPVTNGNYAVTLKFVEMYWTAAGKRIFSVAINGQSVISRLDLYATVGKNRAYDLTFPVSVTNGTINLTFSSQVDNATISAIVVKTM